MSEPELPAVTYHVQAFRAFKRAYELERAGFELDQLAVIPSPTLAPEANNQRMAVFKIAQRLLNAERDKAMDDVVKLWTTYRSMRPPNE